MMIVEHNVPVDRYLNSKLKNASPSSSYDHVLRLLLRAFRSPNLVDISNVML
jgi:hypothetical protein